MTWVRGPWEPFQEHRANGREEGARIHVYGMLWPESTLPTSHQHSLGRGPTWGMRDSRAIVTTLKIAGLTDFQSTGPETEMQIQEEEEFRGQQ